MLTLVPLLAALSILAPPTAAEQPVTIPDAGIRFNLPPGWRIADRESTPVRPNASPPFPRGGTFTVEGTPARISGTYFVYDPKLAAAQRAKYSESARLKRLAGIAQHTKVLRSGAVHGVRFTEFETRRASGSTVTVVRGIAFGKGLVEGEITLSLQRRPIAAVNAELKSLLPGLETVRRSLTISMPAAGAR